MTDRIFLGHTTKIVTGAIARPVAAAAYASGDVVGSAAADPVIVFDAIARSDGGSGMIMTCRTIDSANQATQPSLELWLFTARPLFAPGPVPADGDPFIPSDVDMANLVGVITMSACKIGNPGVGAAGNLVIQSDTIALPFKCAGGDDALYGVLVVRNGYTPVTLEQFSTDLTALQDY